MDPLHIQTTTGIISVTSGVINSDMLDVHPEIFQPFEANFQNIQKRKFVDPVNRRSLWLKFSNGQSSKIEMTGYKTDDDVVMVVDNLKSCGVIEADTEYTFETRFVSGFANCQNPIDDPEEFLDYVLLQEKDAALIIVTGPDGSLQFYKCNKLQGSIKIFEKRCIFTCHSFEAISQLYYIMRQYLTQYQTI